MSTNWLVTIGSSAIVLVALLGYLNPTTRPYVKKFWWVFLAAVPALLLGALYVSRLGSRRPAPKSKAERGAVDRISEAADQARANAATVDAELVRRRLETQAIDQRGAAHLAAYDEAVRRAREEPDPARRRQKLVELVEGQRGRN
jgi:hypothetical protein